MSETKKERQVPWLVGQMKWIHHCKVMSQRPTTILRELNYHDHHHDSKIKVSVIETTDLSAHYKVFDCDQGILEALIEQLQRQENYVEFASTNWVHPLKNESDVVLRRTERAVTEGVQLHVILLQAINTMSASVLDCDPYFQQRWHPDGDWIDISAENPALCEGPDGLRVQVRVQLGTLSRTMCNVYRRFLLSQIPTLAIESLTIRENTSMLADQVLAQRAGMVPVRYRDGEIPPTHFDNACFRMQLSVPGDSARTITPLTTRHMDPMLSDVCLAFTGGDLGFDLAVLSPGQCVEAIAQVGVACAEQHVKHVAVGQVGISGPDENPNTDQAFALSFYLCGQLSGPTCFKSASRSIVHSLAGLRQGVSLATNKTVQE